MGYMLGIFSGEKKVRIDRILVWFIFLLFLRSEYGEFFIMFCRVFDFIIGLYYYFLFI